MGEITNTGDTGTIVVRVHYTGPLPGTLVPSFVSPGTVSVEGATQTSGTSSHDFTQDLYYKVVSQDGQYTRTYRVTVEFVNEEDSRPRIETFVFTTADNLSLTAGTSALIDHGAGLIVIEAVYDTDPVPSTLIPRFSAGGPVSVSGAAQTSGVNSQDFSHKVKYTVKDPGNPGLFRDYWVETRFVKSSQSLAEISLFRFEQTDNPGLCADVTAVIDQGAGTIYAVLPFTGPPPTSNGGHRILFPRWLAQGTVQVGGVVQASGTSGAVFAPQTVYRVVSADGAFYRDYTVKVLEVNTRIYVDKDAAGDNTGVSWTNAFRSLADACNAAEYLPTALPAELWIAEGSYRPSETRNKAAYFKVRPATGYYGGFAGTETTRAERVPGAHPVTITGDLGGGVYAEHLFMNKTMGGGNAAFGEMKFTKAKALTGDYYDRNGPAVYVENVNNLTITGSVFEDLEARVSGGAVYASSSGGSITITGSIFKNTQAVSNGGAVYATSSGDSVSITGCGFETIQSGTNGGAVYAFDNNGGFLSITGCGFKDIQTSGFGGAVIARSSSGSINIADCTFEDTQATGTIGYGGAVYTSGNSVSITGCIFETIRAAGIGGAVAAYSDGASISITDCTFGNTQAGTNGGAVYASLSSGSPFNITDCDFEDTQAASYGGAVYASNGSVTMADCTFKDTQAASYGGAVYASNSSVTMADCHFKDTQAGSSGGAVYTNSSSGSISIEKCTFETIRATGGGAGGAVSAYSSSGSISIADCTFEDTQAISSGGAVSAGSFSGSISIAKCDFETIQTTGGGGGGAIQASSSSGASLSITYCDFETIQATGPGGAVYVSSGNSVSVSITHCGFKGTQAVNNGGAVYASPSSGASLSITYCDFENTVAVNTASDNYVYGGGGICISGNSSSPPTAALSNLSFTNVHAQGSATFTAGGAVVSTSTVLTMTDCTVNGATSDKVGGAIGCYGPSSCVLNKVSFTGCIAPQGSVLYGSNTAYTVGPNCKVEGTTITSSNLNTILPSPDKRLLTGGSTISVP
jgi:hypothetical protein